MRVSYDGAVTAGCPYALTITQRIDLVLVEDTKFEEEVGFDDLFSVGVFLRKSSVDEAFAEGFLEAGIEFGCGCGFDLHGDFGFGIACFVEEYQTNRKFLFGGFGRSGGALLQIALNGIVCPEAVSGGGIGEIADGVGVIFESKVLRECFVAGILGDLFGPVAQEVKGSS